MGLESHASGERRGRLNFKGEDCVRGPTRACRHRTRTFDRRGGASDGTSAVSAREIGPADKEHVAFEISIRRSAAALLSDHDRRKVMESIARSGGDRQRSRSSDTYFRGAVITNMIVAMPLTGSASALSRGGDVGALTDLQSLTFGERDGIDGEEPGFPVREISPAAGDPEKGSANVTIRNDRHLYEHFMRIHERSPRMVSLYDRGRRDAESRGRYVLLDEDGVYRGGTYGSWSEVCAAREAAHERGEVLDISMIPLPEHLREDVERGEQSGPEVR